MTPPSSYRSLNCSCNHNSFNAVIPSEQSESRDLRTNLTLWIIFQCVDPSTPFHFARDDISLAEQTHYSAQFRQCVGGVVLRAANQNQMIAGGNHTMIYMTPPYDVDIHKFTTHRTLYNVRKIWYAKV